MTKGVLATSTALKNVCFFKVILSEKSESVTFDRIAL